MLNPRNPSPTKVMLLNSCPRFQELAPKMRVTLSTRIRLRTHRVPARAKMAPTPSS